MHNIVDVQQEPQIKTALLTGRLNSAQCPHCNTVTTLSVPILYHDPEKELLIAMVPMGLNLPNDEQEKVIGDLMRDLTAIIPKESFKGYMFRPQRALTMQGLIDQVLQGDGVTLEMIEEQRKRVDLAQSLLEIAENDLPALVAEHDERIDSQLFQVLTLMAQRVMQEGQRQMAEQIMYRQDRVAELSTYGQEVIKQQAEQEQTVREIAEDIQSLGAEPKRRDFLSLARSYADDDDRLQALVGLVRPAFDYAFFQELSLQIGQAPAADRGGLEKLRDRLLEMTQAVDQQTQLAAQQAASFLQAIMNSPNPEDVIRDNLTMIDDTFMAVLTANIQEAERQKNLQAATRLKTIYDQAIAMLQEQMEPELRFVNDLLRVQSEADLRHLIEENLSEFDGSLLEIIDGVEQMLTAQGAKDVIDRLAHIRHEIAAALE
jgi:hypothetical protein